MVIADTESLVARADSGRTRGAVSYLEGGRMAAELLETSTDREVRMALEASGSFVVVAPWW